MADLNGDGRPDIVTANYDDNSISVLLNRGDGMFPNGGPTHTFAVGFGPDGVAIADFNQDKKPDIVVVNGLDETVNVLAGNGDGTFPGADVANTISLNLSLSAVSVADLNGDGIPDIITGSGSTVYDYQLSVILSRGDGSFQTPQKFTVGYGPSSVVSADINGDGLPDVISANTKDNTVSVLLGDGTSLKPALTPSNSSGGSSVASAPVVADFNHDGTLDSVVLDGDGNILFRMGRGTNTFAAPVVLNPHRPARDVAAFQTTSGIAVAAADASFDPLHSSAGHIVYSVTLYTVLANGLPGPARPAAILTASLPTRIAAADLTGDGRDDIVLVDALDDNVQVAFQQADGTFTAPITIAVGSGPSDVVLSDVNGDRRPDIVVSDQTSGDVTVLLNDGDPTAKRLPTFNISSRFRGGIGLYGVDASSANSVVTSLQQAVSLTVGQFTGSGNSDLVVVNRGTDSFSILGNDGGGGFFNPISNLTFAVSGAVTINGLTHTAVNTRAGSIVASDFNRDQHDDVALLMEDTAELWIYINQGDGQLVHTSSIDVGTAPTGLSQFIDPWTGLIDLAVGDVSGDVLILQGNGDGTFQPPRLDSTTTLAAMRISGQQVAVVTDPASNKISVQMAAAGQSFQALQGAVSQQGLSLPGGVQVATVGGIPYIVVANAGGNDVLVFQRQRNGQFTQVQDIPVGTDPVSVTVTDTHNVSDINGDKVPDVLVADKGSNDVSVLFGSVDSSGNWALTPGPRLKAGGTGPVAVAVVPAKPGGNPSLLVTNHDSNNVSMIPGVGQGFFNDVNSTSFPTGNAPVQTFVGNFGQGQGFVTIDSGSNDLTYYPSLDSSAFQVIGSGGLDPVTGVAEDLSGDGVLDLLVGNMGDGVLSLYFGGENGPAPVAFFADASIQHPAAMALADLGVGQPMQLLVVNEGDEQVRSFNLNQFVSALPTPESSTPVIGSLLGTTTLSLILESAVARFVLPVVAEQTNLGGTELASSGGDGLPASVFDDLRHVVESAVQTTESQVEKVLQGVNQTLGTDLAPDDVYRTLETFYELFGPTVPVNALLKAAGHALQQKAYLRVPALDALFGQAGPDETCSSASAEDPAPSTEILVSSPAAVDALLDAMFAPAETPDRPASLPGTAPADRLWSLPWAALALQLSIRPSSPINAVCNRQRTDLSLRKKTRNCK